VDGAAVSAWPKITRTITFDVGGHHLGKRVFYASLSTSMNLFSARGD
jgi:hypothetical protein